MKKDWIFEQYVKEIAIATEEQERRKQAREKLILRGSCCGKTCEQCPYDPPFVFGNKTLKTSP